MRLLMTLTSLVLTLALDAAAFVSGAVSSTKTSSFSLLCFRARALLWLAEEEAVDGDRLGTLWAVGGTGEKPTRLATPRSLKCFSREHATA